MNRIQSLIILVSLLSGMILHGQDIPAVLKERNEVYFSFNVKEPGEINALTGLISIDDVRGNSVKAYANMAQYLRFMKLGYDITLLPVPGNGPGVEMRDHIVLSPSTVWNYYPTYSGYESLMAQFQSTYPAICHLDTITTLASGRRLLVLKISDNVNSDEAEPEFLYTSSIHGDETTGYILMLHLADYLLSNYGTNPEATDLVNSMEIFICPLANPDGTYYGGNSSVSGARRYNINGVDMNRNYPDPQAGQHPDGNAWQPETVAFMNFASLHHFVGACNFHGGAEVVNYPWDTWAALHPDDLWFYYISREYADTVHIHAPAGYLDDLNNGITNGYAWYQVTGGRQDYMNYVQHCKEITIEISVTKLLPTSQLLAHWDYNWRSFILLLKEARYGIQGIITDQVTGSPVAAKVFITGHDNLGSEVYSSANPGDYHRPVKAGTYTLEITAPCYQTQTITGVVIGDHANVILNIQMVPGAAAAVTTTAVSAITMSGATSGGNVSCAGNSPVTARGVCWSTTSNPVVSGNHTSDGTGPGPFTSLITGLSPNTAYHVRAYATNASGTYYGAGIQFSSACGTVVSLPWGETFENNGLIPNCWSQVDYQGNGQMWQFGTITGQSPNPALSGMYAYLNSDAYGNGNAQNADLITPVLNLTPYNAITLQFSHYFKSYSGSSGTLSYSINNGTTWILIQQFTATSATNPVVFSQVFAALAGQSQVRFKWNYTGSWGYYWAIDNVQVTGTCISTLPVGVTINAASNPACAGSSVLFTAAPTNGGTAPAFQWKINGANVSGATNSTYTYAPVNGNTVSCVLTSNATCITGNPATSNTITMTVNPVLPVSVLISPSSNTICAGTPVTFSPSPTNGGTPVYQWFRNSVLSGTGNSYTCAPGNGDQVYAVMTSSLSCITGNPATSNIVTMTVDPLLSASISIAASANPVIGGTPVTFTASPVNGGSAPVFQWVLNGGYTGTGSDQFTCTPVNGDVILCILTSGELCTIANPVNSNSITMVVNTVALNVGLQNVSVTGAECYNAVQTISVAGSGSFFAIHDGGSATMIAGQNILFYPGTLVEPGGYLYGYIAQDGPWCGQPPAIAVMTLMEDKSSMQGQSLFSVYPNPTRGEFTFEVYETGPSEKVTAEIYSMTGELLFSKEFMGGQVRQLSLNGKMPGIYLLRIITERRAGTTRIVKYD